MCVEKIRVPSYNRKAILNRKAGAACFSHNRVMNRGLHIPLRSLWWSIEVQEFVIVKDKLSWLLSLLLGCEGDCKQLFK